MDLIRQIIFLGISSALVSCTSQLPYLTYCLQSETLDLKEFCNQQTIKSPERTIADSICTQGDKLLMKGKNEAAYALFDRANIYYHIALINVALMRKESEIVKEQQALSRIYDDVAAYKQVLKELKTME